MTGPVLTSTMTAADQLTVLSRTQIERRGRWRSFRRALSIVLGLLVVLVPLYLTCTGRLFTFTAVPSSVPARLALLVELALVRYCLQFAWRCLELVRSSRSLPLLQQATTVAVAVVCVSELGHAVENCIVWIRVGTAETYPVDLALGPGLFWLHVVVTGVGLIACGALAVASSAGLWWTWAGGRWQRRWALQHVPPSWVEWVRGDDRPEIRSRLDRWKSALVPSVESPVEPERGGTIICCSGGGIRSASFCLGALQELSAQGIYGHARAVVGVSGGGYIAAALHVLRWQSSDELGQRWAELTPRAFAPTSEETRWLRRHTRYLFDSVAQATLAGLSIVFGMTVNLFWCAIALGAFAWWLGWLLAASGGLSGWNTVSAVGGRYLDGWFWLGYVWLVPAVGAALFVLERVVTRLVTLPVVLRNGLRMVAVTLLWVGTLAYAVIIGLPTLMAAIHNYAATSDSVWAGLVHVFGLVPDPVCGLSARSCGTRDFIDLSGPQTSWGSFAAAASAILAVVRVGMLKLPGTGSDRSNGRLARLAGSVQHVLLPWAALLVIMVAALTLVMSWVADLVARPEELASWNLIYGFVIALVALTIFTDANWTSLHHFYREQISYAFLQQRVGGGSRPVRYRESLRFSQSAPPEGRGPELVACAVANVSDVEYVPADRRATPFIFDQKMIGLTDRTICRQMPAGTYEFAADFRLRDATIPAAMAMSGAAFSPLVGREHRRVAPFRLVMALANARLGVWLPNPLWADDLAQVCRMIKLRRVDDAPRAWWALADSDRIYLTSWMITGKDRQWLESALTHDEAWFHQQLGARLPDWLVALRSRDGHRYTDRQIRRTRVRAWAAEIVRSVLNQPGPYRLFKEGVGRTSLTERRLYITDGGHYDNLGLVEALRRRADVIYVLDASNDSENSFRALGEAVATARIDLDCEVVIDPTPMSTNLDHLAPAAWQSGTITYADGSPGVLHVVKAVRTSALSLDTQVYAGLHPEFPRTSTSDQFYGELDFEAYRQLGFQATQGLLTSLGEVGSSAGSGRQPADRPADRSNRLVDLVNGDGERRPEPERALAAR
jgi:hypothetical protein